MSDGNEEGDGGVAGGEFISTLSFLRMCDGESMLFDWLWTGLT